MRWKQQLRLFVVPGTLLAAVLIVMFIIQRVQGLFVDSLYYDKVMHTLGGAGACVLVFLVLANCSRGFRWAILRFGLPLVGLISGLIIGVAWEVVEVLVPAITDYVLQGWWDTFFDLVFDCLGGYIAGKKYQGVWRWQY
ncbi:MAG: hypothetical protein NUV88_01395 [Candidatus Kaiserbacteria bacterium]|nr:hypothetical protein [Candidatus Kaiserbacteria bacterium]